MRDLPWDFCDVLAHLEMTLQAKTLSGRKNTGDCSSKTVHWFSGRKLGFTIDLGKLHNVSLGQGQEAVAELAMEKAAKEGHWVILQV